MTSIPQKPSDPPVKKNAFVHKLYSMLSNPKLTHLIWWTNTPEANTFALYPSKEFADALSGYFKHGNVALFVRQLHMYGFHKVSEPQLLVQQAKDGPIWEFRHSLGKFKKDDEKSLVYIKRRSSLNLLRNSVVEKDLARTLSPLPLAFDHYQPNAVHYTLAGSGQTPVYAPVAYMPQGAPYPYMAQPSAVSGSIPGSVHPMLTSGMVSVSGGRVAPQAHAQYPVSYHLQGMMLPPPPPHDGRMYHVQWQLGTPVYAQYYPVPTADERQDGAQLKFRKPWELLGERPRNPSLLFDPLAPANPHLDGAGSGAGAGAGSSVSLPAVGSGPGSAANSPKPDMIKLPPLGRAVLPSVKMLGPKPTGTPVQAPVQAPSPSTATSLVTNSPQPSLPPTLILQQTQQHPLATQLWPGKCGSTPVSKSVFDKLRPSLIELHFPQGSPSASTSNSITGKPADLTDSIGSHSLSIFSGISSILSTSSGRTSSFGSISHIMTSEKHRSIGPHESTPVSPQLRSACLPSVTTIKEEKDTSSETVTTMSKLDTPSEISKPSTPLHKAKVEYLLDAPEAQQQSSPKRAKIEPSA